MDQSLDQRVVPLANPEAIPFVPLELTAMSGTKMKGFTLLHLLDLIEKQPGGADAWRATLPESVRAQTERRAITSVAWLPMELYFHGVTWLTKQSPLGVRHALSIGHAMAKQDIGAFFGFIMKFTSPTMVLGLSGRFWRSYFDASTLNVVASTATSVDAEIRDWPLRDEVSLHEMAGSLIAWMEASRAKNVRITRFERLSSSNFCVCASWS
ncbi:MAG: hypothetical protein U0228_24540 [Myxococcaceae bacterium]